MIRAIIGCMVFVTWAVSASAQELGALARFEGGQVRDGWRSTELALDLSQPVPWRVFTLSNPNRVVIDFREVDWGRANPGLTGSDRIPEIRTGAYLPGWSRLVAVLAQPMVVSSAEMRTDDEGGRAHLELSFSPADQTGFDARAGAPASPDWDLPKPAALSPRSRDKAGKLVVVLDPGHGGIDPGAENGAFREADLMLTFARELRDVLRRTGRYEVFMTRDADRFVSLEARVAAARRDGADLFLSLHADSLASGKARGASVYTLSDEATDAASAALAERHDRDDILAGVDLSGTDDRVAGVLMDLARLDNTPRSEALAGHLVRGIANAVGQMHKHPHRRAGFSVLKAADIPSALIEVGFLSTGDDLQNLTDPVWRAAMAAGIRDGVDAWAAEDAALAGLRRK